MVDVIAKLLFAVLRFIWIILAKLRLLPAALFMLITQIWFFSWVESLGTWYEVIVIALAAIGLGSFVVQGIIKLREHIISSKYEAELKAEREAEEERQLIDELYKSGRITRIDTTATRR